MAIGGSADGLADSLYRDRAEESTQSGLGEGLSGIGLLTCVVGFITFMVFMR